MTHLRNLSLSLRFCVALLAATALAACVPAGAEYDFGYATHQVSGRYELAGFRAENGAALAIVYKQHYKFLDVTTGKRITHPTAHVVVVRANGAYSVDMPNDVTEVDILFVAPDYLTHQFRFKRQIGIGNITFNPKLKPMIRWRDHYYTYLLPQLEHLIVDVRYKLSNREQQILGDWLHQQQARLSSSSNDR